jgi:hypothetical protein
MADGVFNIAKGEVKAMTKLAIAGSGGAALVVVLLKSAGLVGDSTLVDYDDLAALLAGASDEANFTNYARKVITGGTITNTVDDTNDRMDSDIPDQTWTSAGGATNNTLGKLVVCFRPATGSADSALVPLTHHDFPEVTTGSDIVAQIATAGFYRAS